jgi:hypothetical protein
MSEQTTVYVAYHEHEYAKIGKSNNPINRVSKLQTGSPYQIRLYTTIKVEGDWSTVEQALHDAYADDRIHGEWFDISEAELRNLVEITRLDSEIVESMNQFSPTEYIKRRDTQRGDWILQGRYERA